MAMLKTMLTPKWRWVTLFAVILFGVFIRLGIWQLDRNAQRVAFDKRINDLIYAPPVPLTLDMLNGDLIKLEYHAVAIVGTYDFANQIGLRNQVVHDDRIGIHLLTPLVISGTKQAMLVDRGWIPQDEAALENWKKFDEPGVVQVSGIIRITQSQSENPPGTSGPIKQWNLINLPSIAKQMPYPLASVYLQQSPDRAAPTPGKQPPLPLRLDPELETSDGSNVAYASQWFMFSILVVIGYPYYVRRQEKRNTNA
jgi:surfeit locus 1 family protein